jgi:hypothetical protein
MSLPWPAWTTEEWTARLAQASVRKLYDEAQHPRDERGRWADIGQSSMVEQLVKPDGGFTYSPTLHFQPRVGFVVSVRKDREEILPLHLVTEAAIVQYMVKNWDVYEHDPLQFVGGWHKPGTDKVYLDVSTVLHSAAEAERLGRAHHQDAYFDLSTGLSVEIDYRKESYGKARIASHAAVRPGRDRALRKVDRQDIHTGRDRPGAENLGRLPGVGGEPHDPHALAKAASDPFWHRLHAIADQAEPDLRAAILQAIADTVRGVDMAALKRALDAGNLDAAMHAIPWTDTGEAALRAAYREILTDAYLQAGELSAESLGDTLGRVGISFDRTNPRAEAWAENVGATRVMEVSDETVSAIRDFISRGFDEGRHPRQTASLLMGEKNEDGIYDSSIIGLTENQASAVENYRVELENDEIERSTDVEDRMVQRYANKLLRNRAETISRNETMKSSSEGQRELWLQARENGFLRGDEKRVWIVTPDDRLCPLCDAMGRDYGDNDQGIGLDEPYITPDGEEIMVPTDIHIMCRCTEGLVSPDQEE